MVDVFRLVWLRQRSAVSGPARMTVDHVGRHIRTAGCPRLRESNSHPIPQRALNDISILRKYLTQHSV